MKIVINSCFGGFGLSREAFAFMGVEWDGYGFGEWSDEEDKRSDPKLIKCVETLGEKANGESAFLKVVEIPDDVKWTIHEYDGFESIHELHRSWR